MKKKSIFTPAVVALVMLSFFLGTSEFIVVGILPEISEGFDISLTKAGNIGQESLTGFVLCWEASGFLHWQTCCVPLHRATWYF